MEFSMFDFLRELIVTEDGLILFLLGLIVIMEIVDFLSGTFAAIINWGGVSTSINIADLFKKDYYVMKFDENGNPDWTDPAVSSD